MRNIPNKKIINILLTIMFFMLVFNNLFCEVTKLEFYITSKIDAYGPIFGEEYTNSARITTLMFESPLVIDNNWTIQPNLFTKSNVNPDYLSTGLVRYTFDLKKGIKWADGRELTAKDIEFTFHVIKNENVISENAKSKIEKIHDIKHNGKYKVDVTFTQQNQDNLGALTFNILPEHKFADSERSDPYHLKPSDPFFQEDPVGCGMYNENQIMMGIVTMLDRNELYSLTKKPIFEEINISRKENISNIVEELLNKKEVNLMLDVPLGNREKIIAKPNLDVISYMEYSWDFVAFNLRKPIFKDKNVREAINLAVSTAEMNDNIFKGEAKRITGPFPPTSPAYNAAFPPIVPNPDKAKELLAKSGWVDKDQDGFVEKDGKKLELHFTYQSKTSADDNTFTSIKNYLKKIGIDLFSVKLSGEDFNTKVYKTHDFDMALVSYKFGTDPEIYTIFHSTGDKPMGNNVCGFSFPEIDEKLEEARNAATRDIKIKLYKILHPMIYNKYPGIFLWQKPKFIAFDRDITGIKRSTLDPINVFKYIYKW